MLKVLTIFLFSATLVSAENRYSEITKRNAFGLADEKEPIAVKPISPIVRPVKLNLTGIITRRGITTVYIVSNEIPKKYLTISTKQRTDSGVSLLSVTDGLVKVNNNGTVETLSFATHKLPTVVTLPALKTLPTIVEKKDSKDKSTKSAPASPKPNVVTVPSRSKGGITDPRMQSMMERGLEYLNKIEDKEKRDQIMKRLESLQSGQYKLKSNIDQNERRRQYDEWRKRRNRND